MAIKKIVFLGDGMADRSKDGGPTPLMEADTPNMDAFTKRAVCGAVCLIPDGMPVGSDVANLAVMGYDTSVCYSGRGPLEAASLGLTAAPDEIVFRCNVVAVNNAIMEDFSAGHISSEDAAILIDHLNKTIANENVRFYSGVSYRHIMVVKKRGANTKCTPPHDITGQPIEEYLPQGEDAEYILDLIARSRDVLMDHPLNKARIATGKNPANQIWPWAQGRSLPIGTYQERYGFGGGVITGVDLIRGIGILAGLTPIDVPGATGYLDTDYTAKGKAALDFLNDNEFVYIHVEAPDEAGHMGDRKEKIKAIERFDREVVGQVIDGLEKRGDRYRALLLPDHFTPLDIKTHLDWPVPFAAAGDGFVSNGYNSFDETILKNPPININPGYNLIKLFFDGKIA